MRENKSTFRTIRRKTQTQTAHPQAGRKILKMCSTNHPHAVPTHGGKRERYRRRCETNQGCSINAAKGTRSKSVFYARTNEVRSVSASLLHNGSINNARRMGEKTNLTYATVTFLPVSDTTIVVHIGNYPAQSGAKTPR